MTDCLAIKLQYSSRYLCVVFNLVYSCRNTLKTKNSFVVTRDCSTVLEAFVVIKLELRKMVMIMTS